jgi:hypothetical protein
VDYRVADLLSPPSEWAQAFDLVVESNTVQALPRSLRAVATASVASFLAPDGTLLVLAAAVDSPSSEGPPWPLTPSEIAAFAVGGVREVSVERLDSDRFAGRWRAMFTRGGRVLS